MKEFGFSEKRIRKWKRSIAVMSPFLLLGAAGFGLYISDFSVSTAAFPVCCVSLVMLSVFLIQMPLMSRSLREMKVVIGESGVVKRCGKTEDSISWKDVSKVRITKDARGDTVRIRIGRERGKSIHLGGFVEMDAIASLVRKSVPEATPVDVKQRKLDWDSPAYGIAAVLFTGALVTVLFSLGETAVLVMPVVVALGIGPAFLIWRPLTKTNARLAAFELACGAMLILSGLALLVLLILTGTPLP